MPTFQSAAGPIQYRDSGDGPPIVFVHGLFVTGTMWRKIVEPLSGRFRCIAPDLPLGAHQTPMNPGVELGPRAVAGLVRDLIVNLDLDDVTVVATDTGGAITQLDPDRVVYLGSASKSLAPALRLGWMVLPPEQMDAAVAATGGAQWYVGAISQLTMADFIAGGHYDRHIRRMRGRYRRRRDLLVQRLAGYNVGVRGLSAGLHLLLTLPEGTESDVLYRAGEAGVALAGLARLRHPLAGPHIPNPDGVVVSFGTPADHGFGPAVDALCRVLAATGL
ncbi:Putative transcriptional regulator, GntR family [Mycobacteroides abscessus subsp. abscessus]|nr:Putative transcriptional regulator, GntR family [Mycobacteroides abscessus subsp. abscessus]